MKVRPRSCWGATAAREPGTVAENARWHTGKVGTKRSASRQRFRDIERIPESGFFCIFMLRFVIICSCRM